MVDQEPVNDTMDAFQQVLLRSKMDESFASDQQNQLIQQYAHAQLSKKVWRRISESNNP
jgi:hypothetical protein